MSNGTAAAPVLTFSSNTNTGIYRAGANILGFTTGGVERMRMDATGNTTFTGNVTASGNVGIGAITPLQKLDVSGNAFIRGDISTSNINFSGNLYQNGVLFTGSGGGGSSQWTTGIGSNIYYNSGNVGIGSSNPIATLDVSGNILCSKVIGDLSGNANTVTNGVYTTGNQAIAGIKTFTSNIGIGTTFPTTGLHVQVYTLFNKGLNVFNPGDTIQTMKVTGNNYGIAEFVDSNSVSALIIGSNRNVGIGLNNPLQKLDVSGNAFIRGNVGIGSSNPSATLDVSGNIFASNIITSGNCLLYTSPSPRDLSTSRMPSSA